MVINNNGGSKTTHEDNIYLYRYMQLKPRVWSTVFYISQLYISTRNTITPFVIAADATTLSEQRRSLFGEVMAAV